MKSVFETIQACSNDSSKNAKLAFLKAQVDNAELKEYLRMTYEARINFYMKKVEPEFQVSALYAVAADTVTFDMALLKEIYNKVALRQITGHAAKSYITTLFHSFEHAWEKDLLTMLIQRDCRAGFSASTVNKVWPGLVTDAPYMRSSLPDDLPKKAKLNTWPWAKGIISQIKADGMFATITHHDKTFDVTIETRSGSPFPTDFFRDIVSEVRAYIPSGTQIHGELLIKRNGVILPRQTGNGIFNSVLQGGEFEAGDVPVFHAWDTIPNSAALPKNAYEVDYVERLELLESYLDDETRSVTVIDYEIVYSLAEAFAHCKRVMMSGLEGTVIKHPEMFWEDRTSQRQVKLKLTFDVDLFMRGLKAADPKSKHVDTFGSMECESSCGMLEVNVTGIPDDMRQEIFDDFEARFKDKVIAVSCNGVLAPSDSNEKWTLFLPRRSKQVLEVPRLDKTEADNLDRILAIQKSAIELGFVVGQDN